MHTSCCAKSPNTSLARPSITDTSAPCAHTRARSRAPKATAAPRRAQPSRARAHLLRRPRRPRRRGHCRSARGRPRRGHRRGQRRTHRRGGPLRGRRVPKRPRRRKLLLLRGRPWWHPHGRWRADRRERSPRRRPCRSHSGGARGEERCQREAAGHGAAPAGRDEAVAPPRSGRAMPLRPRASPPHACMRGRRDARAHVRRRACARGHTRPSQQVASRSSVLVPPAGGAPGGRNAPGGAGTPGSMGLGIMGAPGGPDGGGAPYCMVPVGLGNDQCRGVCGGGAAARPTHAESPPGAHCAAIWLDRARGASSGRARRTRAHEE